MGICITYDEMIVGYKGEDYIRDILRKFKSREFEIETLQKQLYELKEQSDRLTFINEYIINTANNPYSSINEAMLNTINASNEYDNDQFMIMKLISISLKTNNKILFIKNFFGVKTLISLIDICKIIWKVNLIFFTEIVYENSEDEEIKKQIKFLLDQVYNKKHFDSFVEELEGQWKLLISKNEEYNLENCEHFWNTLHEKYDYLFNAIELRHYYYLKFTIS